MEMNRIISLTGLSNFAAPYGRRINPVVIKPGHETIEILTGGQIYFNVNGEKRVFGNGTIFWHIAGEYTIHDYPPDNPYRCLAMGFKVVEERRTMPRITQWEDLHAFEDFCRLALRYAHDERIDNQVLANMLYTRVYWEAYMYQKREETANHPLPLSRAISVMNKNFNRELSIDKVSLKAGVSSPNLYSLFKKHMETTPHQYLLNLRLRHARTLLAGNEKSIKEISMDSGFENLESFYRAFRKNCHMTPAEYRRINSPVEISGDDSVRPLPTPAKTGDDFCNC